MTRIEAVLRVLLLLKEDRPAERKAAEWLNKEVYQKQLVKPILRRFDEVEENP